ncbi:hypothetical protein GEV33_008948 [Tenebrio molitor]|uniref:Uncharacterized protein n=1 Tax=Tenebrio molitor TaxID=7067 RepID=A0A8J6HFR5_TENMO|nr:hypothetical protein GEV33_008948 [Tenebrio molitor]
MSLRYRTAVKDPPRRTTSTVRPVKVIPPHTIIDPPPKATISCTVESIHDAIAQSFFDFFYGLELNEVLLLVSLHGTELRAAYFEQFGQKFWFQYLPRVDFVEREH